MKKYLKRSKKHNEEPQSPARITNETVAEHREQVLAGGRKFKYPMQYQKHKLVLNSIIIGVVTVVLLLVLGWHQLYVAENSSKLMYRITQLIPVPVASVQKEPVRYSDYLMRYRSSVYYLQQQNTLNINTKDGKRQASFIQRQEMTNAQKIAFARTIARKHKLSVKVADVDAFIKRDIDARSVSLNAYEKTVLRSFYDWSLDEYRGIVRDELLKRKARFAVDADAKKRAESLQRQIAGGGDIAAIAKENSDDEATKANGGDSGSVATNSHDPNRLITVAQSLEVGQVSSLIEGVDAYYIIKLVSKNEKTVQYNLVSVALKEFDKQFAVLQKDGQIKEYIKIDDTKDSRP